MAFQDFIYLSEEDFTTLSTNGTATVNGVELTYDPVHTQYYTYDNTKELIADLQAEQAVQGAKITAIEESVKKYYRHTICTYITTEETLYFTHISSRSTAYVDLEDFLSSLPQGIIQFSCTLENGSGVAGTVGAHVKNNASIIYAGIVDNYGVKHTVSAGLGLGTVAYFNDTVTEL